VNTPKHNSNKSIPISKKLHPKNLHKNGYDFSALVKSYPSLSSFVKPNKFGNLSIDFANADAVKTLNTALLKHYYSINHWDIPKGALCPPIPGRVDYIHYVADLLEVNENARRSANKNINKLNTSSVINMLDIGTGANGIYPLLACQIYGWHCVGSDINIASLDNVNGIICSNPDLKGSLSLRKQNKRDNIFKGVIKAGESYDVSVCNPPFHSSPEEALKGSQRKVTNLARNRSGKAQTNASQTKLDASVSLNFGGQAAELWCNGGERLFLKKMINESKDFSNQCRWFTSLVSKADNVKIAIKQIKKLGATEVKEIKMEQGNKITRIIAWTFVS